MTQTNIIGVQFEAVGKNYYFDASNFPDIKPGDPVVVRTSRGTQLATTTQVRLDVDELDLAGFKPVERPATSKDLMQRKSYAIKEDELHEQLRQHLNENDMSGVKIVSIEYSLDGRQLFVALNSENSVHYNLKRLHQDVQKMVKGVHLEIRQIGPRDAAKMIQGMGACGMEKRCCSQFLTQFSSISIRMAKTQDISLTPSEITGMCGRLRCCLSYEYDQYVEAIKTLPKRKKRIQTPMGEGRVIQILPLRQIVIVDIPEIGPRQFTREDLDRAEKMARGEKIAPVKAQESSKEVTMSRPEDQKVDRSNQNKQKKSKSRSSRRRRGRRSRKSNNSKKSSGSKNSHNRNNNNRNKKNNSGRQNNQKKS